MHGAKVSLFQYLKVVKIDEAHKYRGITLINTIAKIYTQIPLNPLTKWPNKENTILQNQDGL